MRRPILLALATPLVLAVSAPIAASAQGWLADGSLRLAPQMTSYTLKQDTATSKISEFAIPIAFLLPISPRLSFDIATAFASATVEAGGKSTISGLTDTQLRLNWSVGSSGAVIITGGLNVPTGQYKVADDKVAAAGQIGNDFLSFPVSSFGNGFAGTGGVALARTLGAWNLGLGASFRKTAEFGAFGADTNATRFQPADEARIRIGVDREAFGGRMTLAAIYSVFGEDACAGCTGVSRSTYSSGDRLIGQVAFDVPTGASQLFVGGWVLHHAAGETVVGAAPAENIMNGQVSLGFNLGSVFLEPSLEGRFWTVGGNKQGTLGFAGVRTKFDVGSIQVSPSASYAMGSLEGSPTIDISGFKAGLTIRIGR